MNDRTFDELFKPIVISIMVILNIALNGLTIAVIARYPKLRDDRTTLFMFSLALSDLANGCTAMPISAALCSSVTPSVRHETNVLPRINAVVSVWFSVTSMHSLCWLTLCKMVAITNPLRYEEILTRNRCYFIICGLWLTGALSGGTVAYYVESWQFDTCLYQVTISKGNVGLMSVVFIIAILCPVVCLVYSTTRIFRAIPSNAPSNCSAVDVDRWRKQPRRHHSVFDSKVCSFRKKRVDCLLDACRTDWSVSF